MTGDWRDFRPAIWLAMLGIAVMLLVSPFFIGAVFLGARDRVGRADRAAPPAAAIVSCCRRERRALVEADHAADAVLALHQLESVVDVVEPDPV